MTETFVLGLDIGTSSVRALVYDGRAMPVEGLEAHLHYHPEATRDGGVTVEAERLIGLTIEAVDKVEAAVSGRGITIEAVGVSCFWHSLVALDGRGQPLTPVFLWADTRPAAVLPMLSDHVDTERLRRRTGAGLHESYWPAKITWLQRTHPALPDRWRRLVSFAEFLYWRLFGQFRVSLSMASGTGLLNIASCHWDEYALSITKGLVPGLLSHIHELPFEGLGDEFSGRWPSLKDVPWYPALGDGACSSVGAGGDRPDRFVVTVGTSSAVRAVVPQPCSRRQTLQPSAGSLWNYRVDAARGILGGALSEGGNLIGWLQANLQLPFLEECEAQIARRTPDSGRLTVLPFIAGERSPDWIGSARAAIAGINLETTAVDILQAAMESVAYQLRLVYDDLKAAVGEPDTVVAAGAALFQSSAWVQIIANVLEHEVALTPFAESSARGAAALALESMGVLNSEHRETPLNTCFSPTAAVEPYRVAWARQHELYTRLLQSGATGSAR